jgi:uncharacterized protein (TIGR02145 family)
MRYLFLSSLLAFSLTASSQIPDYVPTDGLVAWYPFNGNTDDASVNGYNGTSVGVEFVEDRYTVGNSAIQCGYNGSPSWVELPQSLQTSSLDFTLSFWLRPNSVSGRSEVVSRDQDPQYNGDWSFFIEDGVLFFETRIGNGPTNFVSGGLVETTSWSNVLVRRSASTGENQIYLNGLLVATAEEYYDSLNPSNPIHIGRHAVLSSLFYQGDFDDFGVWNRALSIEEILSLTNSEQPVFGCVDSAACNFNPEANVEDGSCYPCEIPAAHCGEGTYWDTESQNCVIANPSDTNFDGCVSMTDLLDLLSVFGTCNETPWSCGDPIEYQGYDYETVQIGDQCWYAENCRFMPFVGGGFQEEPSILVYGYDGDSVEEAQETLAYDMYGALYNFASATQLGLCPPGWHVPSKIEFDELFANLGGIDQAHSQVMLEQAWNVGFDLADEGFSLLPAGWLYLSFAEAGESAYMWTSTPYGENDPRGYAWNIQELNQFQIVYEGASRSAGQSVRCLKDSE